MSTKEQGRFEKWAVHPFVLDYCGGSAGIEENNTRNSPNVPGVVPGTRGTFLNTKK